MGILVFLLLVFFGWAVVLPIASLVSASRAKRRALEAEERLQEREKRLRAFATRLWALEWKGPWREPAAPVEKQKMPEVVRKREREVHSAPMIVEAIPAPEPRRAAPPREPRPRIEPSPARIEPPPARIEPPSPAVKHPPARGSPAEVEVAVAHYSAWREHVRPFLVENIGWFIGGFLIVAGSLYFLREAWGSFAQLGRHLLVVATALAYAGGFIGVALWLKRAHGLATASRAMAYVGLALVPVAALAASGTFDLRPLAWAFVAPAVVGGAYPLLYLAAGLLDRPLAAPLARSLAALLGLTVLAPAVAAFSPQAALALPYLGWAVLHAASSAPLRGTQAPSAGVLAFHLSALAYALLFVIGRAHSLGGAALPFPAFYGPLAVLASFTALRVDVELRARFGGRPEIDAAVVASFAAALAGVALGAREPAYFALSAALAAAHFAAGIAWYRRPLLLYFSIASGTAAVLAVLASPAPQAAVHALARLLRNRNAAPAEMACGAAAVLLAVAAAAEAMARRFRARDEDRLAAAGDRSAGILVVIALALAAQGVSRGHRFGPAAVLAAAAALVALWHHRAPRWRTAWTAAGAFSAAAALVAMRLAGAAGFGCALAAIAAAALAASALPREGERRGASALIHCSLLLAALALGFDFANVGNSWQRELAVLAAVFALGAVALGNALVGLVASASGVALLALALGGPDALNTVPGTQLRWAIVPGAAIAAAFALDLVSLRSRSPRPLLTWLPFPAPGLRALAESLLTCAAVTTALLAARGLFSIDQPGARLLGAAAACALALGAVTALPRWTGTAIVFAALGGAWQAATMLGLRAAPLALGAAVAATAALAVARALRSRFADHAETAIDVGTLSLAAATMAALGDAAASQDVRIAFAALALSAAAFTALVAPARVAASVAALVALGGAAWTLPLALGAAPALSAVSLAALALLLLWTRFALKGGPEWSAPLLRAGPHAAALAALAWNIGARGAFLDWNRALCDGLLCAYLGSALFVEGGAVFVHLLMVLLGLGVVRARTLLGIVPNGWVTVVAGAGLLGLAVALRRREKYANALLIWSALSLGYTCAWCFSGSALFVPADRWNRMAAAALVAVPLAPRFFPLATSAAAVAALSAALLGAFGSLWTPQMWPLVPAALALAWALAAEPIERISQELFCAPVQLAKSLRAAALVLGIVPAGMTAWAAFSAALRLPGVNAAGPGAIAAIPLLLGGAALALAFRKLDQAPSPVWPISIGAALALAAVILPAASSFTPGGGALVLLGEAAVAALVAGKFADLRFLAPALWVASLAATHLAPGEWTTAAALLAGAWFLRGLKLPIDLSTPSLAILAGAGFALAWGATRVPFLDRAGVAAPLGLLAAVLMLWHERRNSALNAGILAAAAAVALFVGAGGGSPFTRAPFLLAGGAMLLLFCAARARQAAWWVYLAALPVIAGYAWSRSALGILSGWAAADAAIVLAGAFALAFAQAALRASPVSAPLAHLSALLPAALFFVSPPGAIPICAGAAAAVYGVLSWLRHSRIAAYTAVALVNVALFASWRDRGMTDAQLYTVPLGLSLLAAAQISHGDLSRQQLSWLRGAGCLVLYAGTAMQMLRFEGAMYPLILGGLALVTVIAGIGLQIRAFALLGAATLVADVLANLVRASANNSRVMAVSATLTGFAILGAMIWLSVKREETLALYRRFVRAMDDWE